MYHSLKFMMSYDQPCGMPNRTNSIFFLCIFPNTFLSFTYLLQCQYLFRFRMPELVFKKCLYHRATYIFWTSQIHFSLDPMCRLSVGISSVLGIWNIQLQRLRLEFIDNIAYLCGLVYAVHTRVRCIQYTITAPIKYCLHT